MAVLCLAGAHRAGAATAPVYAFPVPGGHFASPATQIAFRGVPAAGLGTIRVTGSVSGPHPGTVKADSDGDGASFIPAAAFAPGETVTVTTSLNIEGSGNGTFKFRIAHPAGSLPFAHRPRARRVNGDVWWYRSAPFNEPAAVRITKPDPKATGDIFLAPQVGPVQQGPEIIGPDGRLIWFYPLPKDIAATDFRVQFYQGQAVLTWWQGDETSGVGNGHDVIMNSSYQVVKTVSAANGLSADLHEFQLAGGTALITAEYPVVVNATAVGGNAREVVLDSVVQQIDIATGLVEFQWDSLDHVGLTDSHIRPSFGKRPNTVVFPFDYFHVNSIAVDDDGNLLISSRNTWAAYKVNHLNGAIIWALGGRHSSFKLGHGAAFAFQHDVRVRAQDDRFLTLFDDGAGPPIVHSHSRALKLELDLKHKTARVASQKTLSPPALSSYEGNDEQLPGLGDFVGWGAQPYFNQYDAHGRLVFEGRFVGNNITYRAYRFPWHATPSTPPQLATQRRRRRMTVFASWNGATEVTGWRVLGGSSAANLGAIATAPKRGFETAIKARASAYVAVQALGTKGRVLATSKPERVH